jgi:hypothetical protein
MKIALVSYLSPKTASLASEIDDISDKMQLFFGAKSFEEVEELYIGIEISQFKKTEMTQISNMHLNKKRKTLEFNVTFGMDNIFITDKKKFKRSFLLKLETVLFDILVKQLSLLDGTFIMNLYQDFMTMYLNASLNSKEIPVVEINRNRTSFAYSKLEDEDFWKLINNSFVNSPNFDEGISKLEIELKKLSNEQIIGFHLTLREKLIKLNKKEIVAVASNNISMITDDSFLELSCRIVSLGSDFYYNVIDFPPILNTKDINWQQGESLAFIADKSIKEKSEYYDDLPSQIGNALFGSL